MRAVDVKMADRLRRRGWAVSPPLCTEGCEHRHLPGTACDAAVKPVRGNGGRCACRG
jgi:hypothetical protein